METSKTIKPTKTIKVSLDFDEVLWDLKSLTHKFLLNHYNVNLHQITEPFGFDYFTTHYPKIIEGLWNNSEEYSKGKFILGAVEFVYDLIDLIGIDNIQIVTASMPNVIEFKNQIIKSTFGDIKVIHTKDKFLHTKDTILIDDAIHNIEQHINVNKNTGDAGDVGVLFDYNRSYNWNQRSLETEYTNCVRLTNYRDVLNFIKNIKTLKNV